MAVNAFCRKVMRTHPPCLHAVRLSSDVHHHASPLKKTALHDFHVEHGGKMVEYAGWLMPVQYRDLSIANSCIHTRTKASLFDVSHMLQTTVSGVDAEQFLESILVADVKSLPCGKATLSVITNAVGGIIDDCIITRTGPNSFYLVTNAGREDVDMTHMKIRKSQYNHDPLQVEISPLLEHSLFAIQGPLAAKMLQPGVVGDLNQLKFMNSALMDVFGVPNCRVSRCGYTGEDGFEISVCSKHVIELADKLISAAGPLLNLAGLGARDVLRLEAGLCLYGNELSEDISPVEAGLSWCIGKRRRIEGGFLGAETILSHLKESPTKKRVGIKSLSGPPARHGTVISSVDEEVIGVVSSGTVSPTLKCNISMGYLTHKFSKVGTEVQIHVRRHKVIGTVVKMPFVPNRYFW